MSMSAGEVQGCVTRLMVPTVNEIFVPLEEEHLWTSSTQHDSLVVPVSQLGTLYIVFILSYT